MKRNNRPEHVYRLSEAMRYMRENGAEIFKHPRAYPQDAVHAYKLTGERVGHFYPSYDKDYERIYRLRFSEDI